MPSGHIGPRKCRVCHVWLSPEQFPRNWNRSGALDSRRRICIDCARKSSISTIEQLLKSNLTRIRARKGGRPIAPDITHKFLLQLIAEQSGLCALTGVEMTASMGMGFVDTNVSIDRINPDLPYTRDNMRLVCRRANHMKHVMTDDEFLEWCHLVDANRKETP